MISGSAGSASMEKRGRKTLPGRAGKGVLRVIGWRRPRIRAQQGVSMRRVWTREHSAVGGEFFGATFRGQGCCSPIQRVSELVRFLLFFRAVLLCLRVRALVISDRVLLWRWLWDFVEVGFFVFFFNFFFLYIKRFWIRT